MKVHLLSDSKMREIGFTDYREGYWYLIEMVFWPDITFNFAINKDNPEEFEISVIDENFLQPYDYQYFMSIGMASPVPWEVNEKVVKIMLWLQDEGVISGYTEGDYI